MAAPQSRGAVARSATVHGPAETRTGNHESTTWVDERKLFEELYLRELAVWSIAVIAAAGGAGATGLIAVLRSRRARNDGTATGRMGRQRSGPLTWVLGAIGMGVCIALSAYVLIEWRHSRRPRRMPPVRPPCVRGSVQLTVYGDNPADRSTVSRQDATHHVTVYARGPNYAGMQDNDIRGFLDGRFIECWNQVSQTHVRIGRRPHAPVHGEYGLFRVLQRWDALNLPTSAQILQARLRVDIESGPEGCWDCNVGGEHEVLLYAVKKDWNPGRGGTQHDNTSPPVRGEVCWDDVAYQEEPWALPGASFASDVDPRADIGAMPLAVACYRPEATRLDFMSPRLIAYVQERVRQAQPLLFLIKLSDASEDERGSMMALFSADYGDSLNTAHRPELRIEWSSGNQVRSLRRPVLLEYGRYAALPRIDTRGADRCAMTFSPEDGSEMPIVEIRQGTDSGVGDWVPFAAPVKIDADWIEVRLLAARNPVPLGGCFRSTFRDTWVRTAPPKRQRVRWTFLSPSGAKREVDAHYLGDYRWEVAFEPKEIGRWRYCWTHSFTKHPFRSVMNCFDVVAADRDSIRRQLRDLLGRVRASGIDATRERINRFETEFLKLERAAMQSEDPRTLRSQSGRELLEMLKELREALGGKPVPDVLGAKPLKRDYPVD